MSHRKRHTLARLALALALGAAPGLRAPQASASQLVGRDASDVSLAVNRNGEALVTYTADGRLRHVLAWGAINARMPSQAEPQVRFRVDYSGGYKKYFEDNPLAQELARAYRKIRNTPGYLANPIVARLQKLQHFADDYWKTGFDGGCGTYNGPRLAYEVAACRAPDGSYWALQAWHVAWPDLGFLPWTSSLSQTWLELSHWRGPLAHIHVWSDWVYPEHYHRLFGQVTYRGRAVYGYKATRKGVPLDAYGRLVYIDTYDAPRYGPGWRRENSFLTHAPSGTWCYGLYPHDPLQGGYRAPPGYHGGLRGPGVGARYRISVIGPGVTPDISAEIADPGNFDPHNLLQILRQLTMKALLPALGRDAACDAH